MIEAALNESPSTNENKSGLGKGQAKSGTFPRAKRNLIGPYSSKNGGEQAIASSLHRITFLKVKTIAEAPLVRRNQQVIPSMDSVIPNSTRRSFGMLNKLCRSKTDGGRAVISAHHSNFSHEPKFFTKPPPVRRDKHLAQSTDSVVSRSTRHKFEMLNEPRSSRIDDKRAVARFPHCMPSTTRTMEEENAESRHQLPHNNTLTQDLSMHFAGKSQEPFSSKIDGELASASCLSEEYFYYYQVSRRVHSECQPGCHYKSWLLQARNHVRWRRQV